MKNIRPKHKMTVVMKVETDPDALFIVLDGIKIAKRGEPGSPQAKTWVSLEPDWKVFDGPDNGDEDSILIEHHGVRVH
jgi:hypothetical protein